MAAHVGAQTARSLWLHSPGEAHQEHHHRFVTQMPSGMVLGRRVMGEFALKEAKWKKLSPRSYVGVPSIGVIHMMRNSKPRAYAVMLCDFE